jgi:hypothetical protein
MLFFTNIFNMLCKTHLPARVKRDLPTRKSAGERRQLPSTNGLNRKRLVRRSVFEERDVGSNLVEFPFIHRQSRG